MKLNLFEKLFVGAYSIKIGKLYHTFPKTAIPMLLAFILYCLNIYLHDIKLNCIYIEYLSYLLFGIGLLSFFYHDIFKSRKPKTQEDLNKFTTFIN